MIKKIKSNKVKRKISNFTWENKMMLRSPSKIKSIGKAKPNFVNKINSIQKLKEGKLVEKQSDKPIYTNLVQYQEDQEKKIEKKNKKKPLYFDNCIPGRKRAFNEKKYIHWVNAHQPINKDKSETVIIESLPWWQEAFTDQIKGNKK
jgi:hypothetical protein